MVVPGFTTVGISNDMIEIIREVISQTKLYRNPSEFIIAAVRQKIEEVQETKIDQRKIEAFFIRENQIKA